MRTPATAPLAALLLALAACATGGERPPAAVKAAAPPAASVPPLPDSATPQEHLPGVPLDGLTPAQQAAVVAWARETYCYCGCPHTVEACVRGHGGCAHGQKMARLAVRLAGAGVPPSQLSQLITDYYASFDPPKRARLALADFGPPLGDPAAKVTLVEFSDFTCPYCKLFRPTLEKFVEDRPGRVKLVYKPFPILSHPGALEVAQAAEWGRDQGVFWAFHDKLFELPHASVAEVAGIARDLGKDPADLEAALESKRLLPRVKASQADATAAGLRATPTVYLDGRRLALPDLSEWMLEFTLQDEEEWQAHGGWARDEK